MPEFSVLMAVHNGADTLPAQLDAVAGQLADDADVVVVDDCSTDGSPVLLADFARERPNVRLLRGDRARGKASCVNEAARYARHGVLLVLDQDDVIAPGYLRALADATRRRGLAFGRMEYATLNDADHAVALWDHPDQDRARVRFRTGGEVRAVAVGSGCCVGIRRDVFDRIGGFATDVGCTDDIDICIRAERLGYPYVQVPEAVVSYRFRGGCRALFRQRMWYGSSWVLLEAKYRNEGIVRRSTVTVWRNALTGIAKLASRSRSRRLQGAAEVGFSLGQFLGRL